MFYNNYFLWYDCSKNCDYHSIIFPPVQQQQLLCNIHDDDDGAITFQFAKEKKENKLQVCLQIRVSRGMKMQPCA